MPTFKLRLSLIISAIKRSSEKDESQETGVWVVGGRQEQPNVLTLDISRLPGKYAFNSQSEMLFPKS